MTRCRVGNLNQITWETLTYFFLLAFLQGHPSFFDLSMNYVVKPLRRNCIKIITKERLKPMLRPRVAKNFSEIFFPIFAFIEFVARSIREWKNFRQICDFSWNICPPLVFLCIIYPCLAKTPESTTKKTPTQFYHRKRSNGEQVVSGVTFH